MTEDDGACRQSREDHIDHVMTGGLLLTNDATGWDDQRASSNLYTVGLQAYIQGPIHGLAADETTRRRARGVTSKLMTSPRRAPYVTPRTDNSTPTLSHSRSSVTPLLLLTACTHYEHTHNTSTIRHQ